MSEEFVRNLRNALKSVIAVCEVELERTSPKEVKKEQVEKDKPNPEDIDKLFWETLEGVKGPYQQTSKRATNNHVVFQQLQAYMKTRKGFMQFVGYNYWFDRNDEDVIDRRRK